MNSPKSHTREFRLHVDAYLEESHARFPEVASRLGLEKFNGLLGKNDPPAYRAEIALAERTLAAVEATPEASFHGDDWLDRRLFLAMLRTELLSQRDLSRWRNNPQSHCDTAVDSIFDLVLRYSDDLSRALPWIESRLAQLPAYLAAGAECVQKPIPLWTNLAERACEGAAGFLQGIETELSPHSKSPKRLKSLIAGAAKAFADYAKAIRRKPKGPERGYCIGRPNFEYLMRERLGFDQSLPEIQAAGKNLIAQMEYTLAQEARKHGRKTAREILDQAAQAWTPERPLIDEYRIATFSIKDKLAHLGLVTLPRGETLKVLPTPEFLRHHFPTAAYNAPPPYSKKQEGIFWVNDLSLYAATAQKKLAEIRQHAGLGLTAAHEAYPGHHLQFAIQNQHKSKLRRLAGHSIFYEGWTMWCEKMSVEHQLVDHPLARLQQTHDALWRAYRIIIDCGLHDGSLSYEQAGRVLQKGVAFTKARAAADVNWYTSSPTVPMSYLMGRLEVEKLHRRFVEHEGWTLRQFNDWMLSHGAIPYSWITHAHDQRV